MIIIKNIGFCSFEDVFDAVFKTARKGDAP